MPFSRIHKVVLAGSLLVGTAFVTTASASPPVAADSKSEIESLVAALPEISDSHAKVSVAASGPIMEFVNAHWEDYGVGSVWVTHDDGFDVHARILDGENDRLIDKLESEIGIPVERHKGGASLGELNNFADTVRDSMSYRISHELGVVEVHSDIGAARMADLSISPEFVKRVGDTRDSSNYELLVGYAGYTTTGFNANQDRCTVGFTYKLAGTNTQGFATAAHCGDLKRSLRLTYNSPVQANSVNSSLYYESCQDDVQLQHMTGGAGHLYYQAGPAGSTTNDYGTLKIAGGFYIGQWGTMSGATSGTLVGQLDEYAIEFRPGGSDCPVGEDLAGLWFDFYGAPGDSGGPLVLWYGNVGDNYLAATVSFRDSETNRTFGGWIGYIDMPNIVQICHDGNTCGN